MCYFKLYGKVLSGRGAKDRKNRDLQSINLDSESRIEKDQRDSTAERSANHYSESKPDLDLQHCSQRQLLSKLRDTW